MTNFKIPKLSLLLVFIVVLTSTCTTSTVQTLQNPTITVANAATNPVITTAADTVTPADSPQAVLEVTPTYLPVVQNPAIKFFGIYLAQYWTTDTIKAMEQADQGAGKKHTSVGWFIDLQNIAFTTRQNDNDTNNFYRQLEALWNKGYISFVNVGAALQSSDYDVTDNCPLPASANQIASGQCDPAIMKMADLYLQWVSLGGGRRAMIGPLQEMNGEWTSYGKDPNTSGQFIDAYRHIVSIFADKGITRDQVWWVFAPNGYNDPVKPERAFENYYPGDDVVDIVGFSSYNYGYCPDILPDYRRWESYPELFEPYFARMQAMASTKPIIIAETSTTAYYHDGEGTPVIDYDKMNQWLTDNYNYIADRAGVIGVYYFSFPEFDGYRCAIEINQNGEMLSGYAAALSNPVYQYLNVDKMDSIIRLSR